MKNGSIGSIGVILVMLIIVVAGVIYKEVNRLQLVEEGRIITVTAQTNLQPADYMLSEGDTVKIDFVTPSNPVSVGDVVSYYDVSGDSQVGLVTAINEDTVTVFMNAYSEENGTVHVPTQDVYGIVTSDIKKYSEVKDHHSSHIIINGVVY